MQFNVQQQVVVRRQFGINPVTHDVKVGTILAFSPDGTEATVSLPSPGGKIQRAVVGIEQLQPVTDAFKRSSVQFNPAFRN